MVQLYFLHKKVEKKQWKNGREGRGREEVGRKYGRMEGRCRKEGNK